MQEFYMRLIELPYHVEAMVLPNDDGTFDVYVNSRLPEELQRAAFDHEIRHIQLGHLYNYDPVCVNEMEANSILDASQGCKSPSGMSPKHKLSFPKLSIQERKYLDRLSRRLDEEWARDPEKMFDRLEEKRLFDVG